MTWLEDGEAVGAMDSLDYIDPKHPLLQMKSEDGDDYDDVLEEALDFLSNVDKVLEYLKPQNCVAIIVESLFTCFDLDHLSTVATSKRPSWSTGKELWRRWPEHP